MRILGSLAVLAILGLGACAPAEPPLPQRAAVDLRTDPDGLARVFTGAVLTPGDPPVLDPARLSVVQGIEQNPTQFLASRPPVNVLNEAEQVFVEAGRIFELVDWYAAAVEVGHEHLRSRYAWLLERTGQHSEALRQARQALALAPSSAQAHFVLGFVLGQTEGADTATLREVRDRFAEAARLDPEFAGPGGAGAEALNREVERLNRELERRQSMDAAGDAP